MLSEGCNNSRDDVVQIMQQWNDRLRLPLTEIPKGYHRGKIGIVLQVNLGFGLGDYSLLITRHRLLEGESINRDSAGGSAQYEFPMLIRNVQVVDQEQRLPPGLSGVVRLKLLDHVENAWVGNSLYFSFVTGKTVFVPWPRFQDGKFDGPPVFTVPVLGRGKLPDDVVETGAQMVGDLPHQHAKSERNIQFFKVLKCLQEKLRIVMWEDFVTAFLEKPVTFGFQITDVLAGPL